MQFFLIGMEELPVLDSNELATYAQKYLRLVALEEKKNNGDTATFFPEFLAERQARAQMALQQNIYSAQQEDDWFCYALNVPFPASTFKESISFFYVRSILRIFHDYEKSLDYKNFMHCLAVSNQFSQAVISHYSAPHKR